MSQSSLTSVGVLLGVICFALSRILLWHASRIPLPVARCSAMDVKV